jgi:endonuclease YncB( thermonuclease family)
MLAGLDGNLVQIRRGMAWHYKKYQREQPPTDQQSYAAAEIEARQGQAGLWRDVEQVPPWEFRRIP